jgi:small subunit ribosomal protein S18
MSSKKNKARGAKESSKKPIKKKTSVLVTDKVQYVDYKDLNLLSRFMSDRAKIKGRRVTGNSEQQQREVSNAIKNAREMALLPYAKRVASAGRGPRGPRGDSDRAPRETELTTELATEVADVENVELVEAPAAADTAAAAVTEEA